MVATTKRGQRRAHRRERLAGPWLSGGGAAALVVALVLTIDVLALASIVGGRREARAAALDTLRQQTASQARAIEALLATLRADLAFLASSPRLGGDLPGGSENPLSRRWARLEAESTLLLFAEGHPPLITLELSDPTGERLATVARRPSANGALADPALVTEAPPPPPHALLLSVPVDGGRAVHAVVDPARLLSAVLPAVASGDRAPSELELAPAGNSDSLNLVAAEPVDSSGWQSDRPLTLQRSQSDGQLLPAVERLASRWRTTVLLNLVVISLGLPLAVLAIRTGRRAARLSAEREHEVHRRQLEQRLWSQERLATVGRLAASIAHEINNPLAGMANHLTLLEEELDGGELEPARRRAPRVADGIERIRQIVQRTLRLARPSSGLRESVDLVALAEETIALVVGDSVSGNVRLVLEDGDATGVRGTEQIVVQGERTMLGQLLTNLLLNALDFGEGRPIFVRLAQTATETRLTVEDQGPGIDRAVAERLFEPFVSSRGSTGLGLAVCLGIVQEHGGTIVGENRGDGGARFEVRLPRHEATSAPAQSKAAAS